VKEQLKQGAQETVDEWKSTSDETVHILQRLREKSRLLERATGGVATAAIFANQVPTVTVQPLQQEEVQDC
jgi:hypothetical protein